MRVLNFLKILKTFLCAIFLPAFTSSANMRAHSSIGNHELNKKTSDGTDL